VLIADDEPGLIRVLSRCLANWGYEAVPAKDGLEAWGILNDPDPPRVVILDWDMPGLSGVKVCRMLRESPLGADSYVMLLTARQTHTDLVEALEAGADDFISKPFELRELQLRIAKGVSTRERRNSGRAPPLSAPVSSGSLPAGFTLAGKFRLEKKIAEGGMATIWQAVHLSLGINVAVKFMKPEFSKNADYTSFEREARAAAQLRDPHTVRVYDHGLTHDGTPYLVMEYLAGEALWDRVQRVGPLPPASTILLVSQVAAALDEAHARGIIHRDVKPENIVLMDDPQNAGAFVAKLVDFGLAHPVQENAGVSVAGTPMYMTPEHLCGEVPPSPALDIWGLAVTAFMAMTGTRAFSGTSISEIVKAICAPPPVPSSLLPWIPRRVDEWFATACAPEPGDRYPTALALSSAFADAWKDARLSSERPSVVKSLGTMAPTEPDSSKAPPVQDVERAAAPKRVRRSTRAVR
jgi:serine/threonine protein kinase/CheY-like chemotaxis protein